MRRSTRLGLALLATLIAAAGAYTAYWFVVAGRIEDSVVSWAQSARADKMDVSWQKLRVTGFPFAFRVDLENAALRDHALAPAPEIRVPRLTGTARPWDFGDWRLAVREGFTAEIAGAGQNTPATLTAQTADGAVSIPSDGGWRLSLRLHDAAVEWVAPVRAGSADVRITVPPQRPHGHADPNITLAVYARQVELPAAIGPLGNAIERLDFGATVKGAIPNGKLANAVAAWRDAGGTIELDNLHLKWDGLDATATGTIALDQELQPSGGFSGAIQGYDQILTALVQSGQMRAGDAGLARIALTMLAKAGPDGRPEIKAPFTIQNGQMFLGPAKLGKMPRIRWE
jgi:hypothetical protein